MKRNERMSMKSRAIYTDRHSIQASKHNYIQCDGTELLTTDPVTFYVCGSWERLPCKGVHVHYNSLGISLPALPTYLRKCIASAPFVLHGYMFDRCIDRCKSGKYLLIQMKPIAKKQGACMYV